MKNHIAVIPARSGSKGLKDKNIKPLAGKPLLQYSVEAAIQSGVFDCVHVSTDNEQYAEIAGKCGADVPFLRCAEFSSDTADSWSVLRYVLEQYERTGKTFDTITLLQPTSPLRTAEDIRNAYQLFCDKEAEAVVSVSEETHSPMLVNTLDESLSLDGFIHLDKVGRRQDMPTYYRINGAVYMLKTCLLERIADLYGKGSYAYIMPQERAVDIDSIMDFRIAEMILEEKVEN